MMPAKNLSYTILLHNHTIFIASNYEYIQKIKKEEDYFLNLLISTNPIDNRINNNIIIGFPVGY